jgi:DNA-binding NarL/FixJ family response regulator
LEVAWAARLASAVDRIVRSMVALHRVEERRRAVALARHFRDGEDLSIADIARRLGRAEATVKAYLYDPS